MGRGTGYPGVEVHGAKVRIVFQYRRERCREVLDLAPTPPNLKYAGRLRAEIVQKIRLGAFDYAEYFPDSPRAGRTENPTFGKLAERWLSINSHLAKATREGYRKHIDALYLPRFGSRDVTTIAYSELAEVIAGYPWGSMKTRNNALTPLRGIFELAFVDGLIDVNPAARIKSAKAQRPMPDPLALAEVDAVLDWMERRQGDAVRNYFELGFFTGLRTSELIALRWEDIDLRRGLIRVQRAKVRGEIKGTKTNQIREVELVSRARAALDRQKARTYLAYDWVFIHPATGEAYNDDKPPRLYWTAALKALGMRHRDAYQTRHTFATLNLMAGANPMWVARQMGHTTMKMLLERYSRWIDQADSGSERGKLEAMLGANLGAKRGAGGDA